MLWLFKTSVGAFCLSIRHVHGCAVLLFEQVRVTCFYASRLILISFVLILFAVFSLLVRVLGYHDVYLHRSVWLVDCLQCLRVFCLFCSYVWNVAHRGAAPSVHGTVAVRSTGVQSRMIRQLFFAGAVNIDQLSCRALLPSSYNQKMTPSLSGFISLPVYITSKWWWGWVDPPKTS